MKQFVGPCWLRNRVLQSVGAKKDDLLLHWDTPVTVHKHMNPVPNHSERPVLWLKRKKPWKVCPFLIQSHPPQQIACEARIAVGKVLQNIGTHSGKECFKGLLERPNIVLRYGTFDLTKMKDREQMRWTRDCNQSLHIRRGLRQRNWKCFTHKKILSWFQKSW